MDGIYLNDLDELVQQVREQKSRDYIVEAIKSYRAGAYRAAIVATWIAVVYDIILKLRELVKFEKWILSDEDFNDLSQEKISRKNSEILFPQNILERIKSIANTEYRDKSDFEKALEQCMGHPIDSKLENLIFKYVFPPIWIFLEEIKKYSNAQNVSKIEFKILEQAKEFKLLLPSEFEDLERLYKDRHKCAHPAFIDERLLFEPTPERSRMHIVHALLHLLRHTPIRREIALKQILNDLKQHSFGDYHEAFTFLNSRYFESAKDDEFIQQLIRIILNALLKEDKPELRSKEHNLAYTLKAIAQKYHDLYPNIRTDELRKILPTLQDEQLLSVFRILRVDPACFRRCEAEKITIQRKVAETARLEDIEDIESCVGLFNKYDVFASINSRDFDPHIEKIFELLEPSSHETIIADVIQLFQGDSLPLSPKPIFLKKTIELYLTADENSVEHIGNDLVLPLSPHFSPQHIRNILEGLFDQDLKNEYILDSLDTPNFLVELYKKTIHQRHETETDWQNFIHACESLGEYEDIVNYEHYEHIVEKLNDVIAIT